MPNVKIIIWDHNKERIYDRAKTILSNEKINERVWAVGHHWYSGDHFDGLRLVYEQLNKPTICTEICAPIAATKSLISLAERYGREICENLNNYNIATCDWNLLLNGYGGPYHNRSTSGGEPAVTFKDHKAGCYAPIMYYEKEHRMEITPIYYYIGHFSKYIKRGARRIATTKYTDMLSVCAFMNPNGEKVAVIMNMSGEELPAVIRLNGKCTRIITEAHSIMTILF